jgi:tyrosyl-tRNA synthetase
MSISDDLMWRYYELLTDVSMAEIDKMKAHDHPMEAKKALARRIVQDFHSEQAAKEADANWAKQFQRDEVPENVERVVMSISEVGWSIETETGVPTIQGAPNPPGVRLDKVLVKCGLVSSGAEAARKIKEGAVRIGGNVQTTTRISVSSLPAELPLRLGKKLKLAVIQP